MQTSPLIWDDIERLSDLYRKTAGTAINATQFSLYAITHHSTKIEGSTLTLEETNALLEKGSSIGGKPIDHQNMVLDHQEALEFVLDQAAKRRTFSVTLLQEIAAKVMRRTGKTVSSVLGTTDETKGDFRKVPVTAGGHYFVDAAKIPSLVERLVDQINQRLDQPRSTEEILRLSFTAHFDLVSIHPFTDGNGRTSRLVMNYIQAYHQQPLTLVNAADRAAYISAITQSREQENLEPFIQFMAAQHTKELSAQIEAYDKSKTTGERKSASEGFSMIF
ncbi:MAG: Fic family protein [Cyclobacteriaceae bacterium]|nr:Fic family protein [Flammeovirgaceae bacterium]